MCSGLYVLAMLCFGHVQPLVCAWFFDTLCWGCVCGFGPWEWDLRRGGVGSWALGFVQVCRGVTWVGVGSESLLHGLL
jgi:hypothetical protein